MKNTRKIQLTVFMVAIVLFIVKIPFRNRLLSWWDSAQFGLALERFSVIEHRPHPPGYPLYILTAKTLNAILNDPALSFVLIGLACSTIAAFLIFKITHKLTSCSSIAWMASCLYALAPLTIYHELRALNYVVGAFFSALIAWEAIRVLNGDERNSYRIALAIGFMGMVRPIESILLLPLAIWAVSRLGLKKFVLACVLYILLQVIWLIPTALLSGGFKPYFSEVLSESAKHQRLMETVAKKPFNKIVLNFKEFYNYLRQSFPGWGFFLLIVLISGLIKSKLKNRLNPVLFALWIGPSFLFFLVSKINYAAIPIFLSPPIAILIAFGIKKAVDTIIKSKISIFHTRFYQSYMLNILTIIIMLHFIFLFGSIDIRLFSEKFRKYDPTGFNFQRLQGTDLYLNDLINGVEKLSNNVGKESIFILSDLDYRVVEYYLPEYKTIWTRYLSQKPSPKKGVARLAYDQKDKAVSLPTYMFKDQEYAYFRIDSAQRYAVLTDAMINNLKEMTKIIMLPDIKNSEIYVIDLKGMWGMYFTFGEFGPIDHKTAASLGLKDEHNLNRL